MDKKTDVAKVPLKLRIKAKVIQAVPVVKETTKMIATWVTIIYGVKKVDQGVNFIAKKVASKLTN